MKIKSIYDKLFTVDYVLAYNVKSNKDIDKLNLKLSTKFKDKIKLEYLESNQGYCDQVEYKDGLLIVIVLEILDNSAQALSVLAHECFHATKFVMDSKGIGLCDETEEVYAYNIGMLMNEFLKAKKNSRSSTMKPKIKTQDLKFDFKKLHAALKVVK